MIFYHVDRLMRISEPIIELSPYETDTLYGSVFNNLSVHGNLYFRDAICLSFERDIEMALEYVRVCKYPFMPSRFQCVFGTQSIKETEYWVKQFSIKNFYNIIHIDTDRFYPLDCSWFTPQQGMIPNVMTRCKSFSFGAMCDMADKYWSGTHTNTPLIEVLIPLPCKVDFIETKKVI